MTSSEQSSPAPFLVRRLEGRWGAARFLRVPDGWLAGFDAGEFGGSLWWFSPDGKREHQISEHQVRGFFHTNTGILATAGLSHENVSEGQVLRIRRGSKGRWIATPLVNLGHRPEAAMLENKRTL
ncbi:MAG TPA: hypothetical protein VK689_14550, partial [Armatimonadota bacterium]|nr:hypothetical protein [Armatimonadota bacterium]